MNFTDAAVLAGTRRREDGALLADARIARTGIQVYLGREVGKPDRAEVRVYRPGAEVFSDATMKSAAHRPVTNDHPADLVSAETWKKHAVGQTGDEVTGEGIFLRVPLMVSDGAAMARRSATSRLPPIPTWSRRRIAKDGKTPGAFREAVGDGRHASGTRPTRRPPRIDHL